MLGLLSFPRTAGISISETRPDGRFSSFPRISGIFPVLMPFSQRLRSHNGNDILTYMSTESNASLKAAQASNACRWCSNGTNQTVHSGACPRIRAIHYRPDGSVKRIDFKKDRPASSVKTPDSATPRAGAPDRPQDAPGAPGDSGLSGWLGMLVDYLSAKAEGFAATPEPVDDKGIGQVVSQGITHLYEIALQAISGENVGYSANPDEVESDVAIEDE